jgi:hypothetical protein
MSSRGRGRRTTPAAIVLAVLAATRLAAWEEDLHHTLTFWLAIQAGFSREDADQIAVANQQYDDSEYRAAIPSVLWILLTNDEGAARELQLKHFPNDAQLPSPPLRRVVTPNSPVARRAVEGALQPGDSATSLIALGEALHPFQDSWSHQGVPDVPFNLRPGLVSAHPKSRGGWASHDADLTHLHVDEVVDVARETYAIYERLLAQRPHLRRSAGRAWPDILPAVRAFAEASSAAEKEAWAVRYVPEQAVRSASRADAPLRASVVPPPAGYLQEAERRTELSQADLVALVRSAQAFLDAWIVRGDIDEALRHVDVEAVAAQLADAASTAATSEWVERFLTLYLIEDHSEVNRAGHGDPAHPRYAELPRRPVPTGPFRRGRLGVPVLVGGSDFVAAEDAGGGHALILSFDHLSHDTVCVVWKQVEGGWKVARLITVVG